jgi:MFS family permease
MSEEKPKNILPILLALTLATVNESLGSNMLLPFVGNLISTITGNPVEDSGFLSGILVASFHFGQGVSGSHWGRLGDKFGRRPIIFSGLCASIATQVLFGFSPSIWMLCLTRFAQGLGNGNMATIKTVVAEISSKENEAMAFSFLTLAWGCGTIFGQSVGGLCYDPVNAWGLFSHVNEENGQGTISLLLKNLFLKFPALAPCLVAALYGVISFFVLSCYLIETNKRASSTAQDEKKNGTFCFGICGGVSNLCCCCFSGPKARTSGESLVENDDGETIEVHNNTDNNINENSNKTQRKKKPNFDDDNDKEEEQEEMEMKNQNDDDDNDDVDVILSQDLIEQQKQQQSEKKKKTSENIISNKNQQEEDQEEEEQNPASPGSPHQRKPQNLLPSTSPENPKEEKEEIDFGERIGLSGAWSLLPMRLVFICYMLLGSHDIAFVECLPLLAILPIATGGFNLSVTQLGLLSTALGLTQISANFIFPIVYRLVGTKVYPYAALIIMVTNSATPLMHLLAGLPATTFFPCIVSLMIVRQLAVSSSYTTVSILLKDAAPKKYLGEIMGLSQSAASFVRLITPVLAAPFFAFTATHETPLARPFNVTLIFFVCGIMGGLSAYFSGRSMGMCKSFSCCFCCCCFSSSENVDDENQEQQQEQDHHQGTSRQSSGKNNCLVDDDDEDDQKNEKRDHSPALADGMVASSINKREVIVMPWEEFEQSEGK